MSRERVITAIEWTGSASRTMEKVPARERFITCVNSQKVAIRGTLMHITGQTAVFEVYITLSASYS